VIDDRPASAIFFSLPKGWEKKVSKGFSEGMTDVEVFVSLGITKREHEAMLNDVEEYRDAIENGMAVAEAYWMAWARGQMSQPSKDVNTKIFEAFMRRMYGWDARIVKEKTHKEEEKKKQATKKEVVKFIDKYIKIAK
jgi:hypothetical protein